jgi:hypothetical protein
MTKNIVEAVRALIPDHEIEEVDDRQLELWGDGGLRLGVMFDIKPDMSIDYERFCCAPFVLDEKGDRKLGHWFSWPFDDMYMQVEPEQLQDLFKRINEYKV